MDADRDPSDRIHEQRGSHDQRASYIQRHYLVARRESLKN
jgi:hypothetical protein